MFYSNAPFLTYSTCSYTVTLKPELTSLKVIRTDTYRSATYDFLLTFHSNHGSISYCFRDRRRFQSKIAKKIHPRVTYAYWTANGDVCKLVLGGQPHTHTHTHTQIEQPDHRATTQGEHRSDRPPTTSIVHGPPLRLPASAGGQSIRPIYRGHATALQQPLRPWANVFTF